MLKALGVLGQVTAGVLLLAAAARAAGLAAGPAPAADHAAAPSPAATVPRLAAPTRLPFGVGELARYRASYSGAGRVGTGVLEVVSLDTVRGHPAYHVQFSLQARVLLFARINDRYESWLDPYGIFSHRYLQDIHELRFRRERLRDFFPAERRWTGHTNGNQESGTLSTDLPLDDASFLYFIRTLDLEVGEEYEYSRYWNDEGNPIRLKVLRRETVTVPAGTFNTVVVQPIIQTRGLFGEGGEAEVYFAEDGAKQVVMLRAKVSFGTLQLQLEDFRPGAPSIQ